LFTDLNFDRCQCPLKYRSCLLWLWYPYRSYLVWYLNLYQNYLLYPLLCCHLWCPLSYQNLVSPYCYSYKLTVDSVREFVWSHGMFC
jgi:hypothetical protein